MNKIGPTASERAAFVALGSNLGDRLSYLRFAVKAMRADPQTTVLAVSPVYESPAHVREGSDEQPFFLNAVVELSTPLDAASLLRRLQHIERSAGRRRENAPPWAPRTLDLDLLIFGDEVFRGEQLTVPHPRMGGRRFVLQPLADLDSDRIVPDPYNKSVDELLRACSDTDRPVQTPYTL